MELIENQGRTEVVIAAGGLGTRRAEWSRYLPKEFYPVQGIPGIVHVLDEIAQMGCVRAAMVHHPYYEHFIHAWASRALVDSQGYARAAERPLPHGPRWPGLDLRFTAQQGPYSDITSVLNADAMLDHPHELYVAYADNLYPEDDPLLRLRDTDGGTSVIVRPYNRTEAPSRGVIVCDRGFMVDLVEKPDEFTASDLEREHGPDSLVLLEGRARTDRSFLDFLWSYRPGRAMEPKLSLALSVYARTHPVRVCPISSPVTDLGSPAP
ncbi:UTP-glucose-1-phosphate uridylyltransferase [Nocardiopsis sp. Huas11]|uniref:sugar phosphate nucleotidyltransferase n=1 Tax=Nocardiopsis sp. Huas11 TaxID=2183912 RepID=UPI000F24E34E|nr:sugar phosphate nucleotidyltransferase [Nocardiopsis sp. Huas11]RKS06593.1 UTP-glucose-1-phosphate uridylyltransferase [Nocardiopsis sp. Huas11]